MCAGVRTVRVRQKIPTATKKQLVIKDNPFLLIHLIERSLKNIARIQPENLKKFNRSQSFLSSTMSRDHSRTRLRSLPISSSSSSSSSKIPRIDSSLDSSEESPLIWRQGDSLSSTGSVLVKLAQSGYTREVHKIIGLSRMASLVGRDSIGGLPELWDVMGRRKGKKGITRLMAVCIVRGSLSPQRAQALIRDHSAVFNAKDVGGRTALHHAVGKKTSEHAWRSRYGVKKYVNRWASSNPNINVDLIRVLLQMNPESAKAIDNDGKIPLHYACESDAPWEAIKLLLDAHPDSLNEATHGCSFPFKETSMPTLVALVREKVVSNALAIKRIAKEFATITWGANLGNDGIQACIDEGAISAFVDLAREKVVIEDSESATNIAKAIWWMATCSSGRRACLNEEAPSAMVALALENAVKESSNAVEHVSRAIYWMATSNSGRQACIHAQAPRALIALANENAVKECADAAGSVAGALMMIAETYPGIQDCIVEGAPLILVAMARSKVVRANANAIVTVSGALMNLVVIDAGEEACIDAGAPLALAVLAREEAVLGNCHAAESVSDAMMMIGTSDTGIQACINAGALAALVALAQEDVAEEHACVTVSVARALGRFSSCSAGRRACIDEQAPLALVALARLKAVKEHASSAGSVAEALKSISKSSDGKQACIAATAPSALVAMARSPIVREDRNAAKSVASCYQRITGSALPK